MDFLNIANKFNFLRTFFFPYFDFEHVFVVITTTPQQWSYIKRSYDPGPGLC